MLRFLTAGESHGPALVTIVEGLPAGIEVGVAGIAAELARRRLGHGRGRRMDIEEDRVEILGGVRFGKTLGSPVAVMVHNTEWPRWRSEMAVEPGASERPLRSPRPGHADLPGMLKYDTRDARDILERASARETAARTVAGHLAKQVLGEVGVTVISHVVAIGDVAARGVRPGPADMAAVDASPVRTFDGDAEARMIAAIDAAHDARDTVGGVVEVLAYGVPAGVGSHVQWDRRLDAALAAAVMSIPAIKAVEFGDGWAGAAVLGSRAHDEIDFGPNGFTRRTQRSGGIEGGISTGETLRLRAAMKPLSTLMRPLATVDVVTKEPAVAFRERSDVCAVPATGVVAEEMVAWVLAAEMMRLYGGDTIAAVRLADAAHRSRLAAF
ncbi:MAG: chorismate synthase [Acidimicrobiia bacterium]|nr:chorismate synthase [Acidimicrobiia bacterium]